MPLDDILPFIAPFARSLAEPTLFHHTKLATVEFCKRTLLLQEELDPLIADGTQTEFLVTLEADEELAKLLRVWVGNDEYHVAPLDKAKRHVRASTYDEVAYLDPTTSTVTINPAPAEDAEVTFLVAIKPSLLLMDDIDDRLAPHLQDIAHGALSGLLALKSPDQDMKAAMANRAMFENRINTVGFNVSRSLSTARVTGRTQFY